MNSEALSKEIAIRRLVMVYGSSHRQIPNRRAKAEGGYIKMTQVLTVLTIWLAVQVFSVVSVISEQCFIAARTRGYLIGIIVMTLSLALTPITTVASIISIATKKQLNKKLIIVFTIAFIIVTVIATTVIWLTAIYMYKNLPWYSRWFSKTPWWFIEL